MKNMQKTQQIRHRNLTSEKKKRKNSNTPVPKNCAMFKYLSKFFFCQNRHLHLPLFFSKILDSQHNLVPRVSLLPPLGEEKETGGILGTSLMKHFF